ncbi:hypothetical protein AWN90_02505 [Nocardia terpenica]|uniref:Uncharacterized protein n=2 Tax=Nocardia terpenica TaxID=455432 RepID=A0A164KPX5_9NOCA|nr:hypothetical protein AWN90_02505 [Nocardia terpenica]
MRVDDPAEPDLDTAHLAVKVTPARLTDTDRELVDAYPSQIGDAEVINALDILMPWEQRLRRESGAGLCPPRVADAVKIAVDGLQGCARVAAEASADSRKLAVWRYKLWWIAQRTDLPWLTDPDDGEEPRYTEDTIDWEQVATAVNIVASELDRDDLVPYYDDTVIVDCDLTALGEEERNIVYNWFNSRIAPTVDPWHRRMVDGRHRLCGVWQANPSARIPILSLELQGAEEREPKPSSRDQEAMRESLARLDTSTGTNRRYARNLAWTLKGNVLGLDHRGGPADDEPLEL